VTAFATAFSRRFLLDRYLAPVLTTVAVGVLVTTLVSYFYTKNTVESLAQGQITQALSFLDREISLQVKDFTMQVSLMSQEEVLRLALEDSYLGQSARVAAQRKLEGHVRSGVFERIYLMNLKGALVLASDPTLVGRLDVSDRHYFLEAKAGRTALDTITVSRVSKRPILVCARPLRGPDGAVLGVVVGITHTESFAREMFNDARIGKSGGAYVLSAQGALLAAPAWAAPGAFGTGGHIPELMESAARGEIHRFVRDGENHMCLTRSNEATGWVLVLEANEGEVLAPATRLAAVSGTISFITLALVALALGALRRVMANLRKSEADHRTLTELSPVGVVTFGLSARPEYINRQARVILGLEPEAPLPRDIALEDAEGRPLVGKDSPIARVQAEMTPVVGMLTWYTPPGGERKILYLNASPLAAADREAHGVVATLEDITERMEALERLHQSEERFSSLFRLSPDSILLTEMSTGVIVDVNDTFTETHGYLPEEVLGKSIQELGLYADDNQRREVMELVKRDGQVQNVEIRGKTKSGKITIFSLSSQIMEIGEARYRISVLRDITERTRAVEQLRQSEERFSRLFRLSPEAISLMDMQTYRLADVNEAFLKLSGYELEELLGKTSVELGFYADERRRGALFEQLKRDGHVENFEFEARRKDGQLLQCSISCHIITIGETPYLMGMLRDVTEIKKMQEMMIQTEKMISVGGIAAGIAHEINNPLGIVLQAAQNLVQRTRPDFQKNIDVAQKLGLDMELMQHYMQARKLDVFIQDIQSAAVRASSIIRHMLDFSRSSESRRKVCDIPGIIDKAVTLAGSDYDLKRSYDFKRIKITRDYDDNLPAINCTETEVEQVLLNLLRNAAQALATSDPPVEAPQIDVRVQGLGGFVRISLSDNGPGMPPEVQRRVFEPFYTTKPPGVGTGLGLSVSYFIITKGHGGKMTVASQPGEGTVFTIDLPTDDARGA